MSNILTILIFPALSQLSRRLKELNADRYMKEMTTLQFIEPMTNAQLEQEPALRDIVGSLNNDGLGQEINPRHNLREDQRGLAILGGNNGHILQHSRLFDAEIPEPGVGHRSPEHGNQEPSPRPGTDHPLRPRLPACESGLSATALAARHHLLYEPQG